MFDFLKPKSKLNKNLIEDKSFYQDLVLTKLATKFKNASTHGYVSVIINKAELNEEIIKILQKKRLKVTKTKDDNYEIFW